MVKNEITKLITERSARIGIIGQGYVGLPLLVEFARNGFDSTGFEVDEWKAAEINAGRSYISDVPESQLKRSGRRRAFTRDRPVRAPEKLRCDYHLRADSFEKD